MSEIRCALFYGCFHFLFVRDIHFNCINVRTAEKFVIRRAANPGNHKVTAGNRLFGKGTSKASARTCNQPNLIHDPSVLSL